MKGNQEGCRGCAIDRAMNTCPRWPLLAAQRCSPASARRALDRLKPIAGPRRRRAKRRTGSSLKHCADRSGFGASVLAQRLGKRFGSLGSLLGSNFTAGRAVSRAGDEPWLKMSVTSKTIPGAASVVPRHVTIVPLAVPTSCSSISSMPNTVGWPAVCLLVVTVAANRSPST